MAVCPIFLATSNKKSFTSSKVYLKTLCFDIAFSNCEDNYKNNEQWKIWRVRQKLESLSSWVFEVTTCARHRKHWNVQNILKTEERLRSLKHVGDSGLDWWWCWLLETRKGTQNGDNSSLMPFKLSLLPQ